MTFPDRAISIRQPWAHAIVYLGKTLENRSWGHYQNHLKKFRGEVCIHASTGMTREEYEEASDFMLARCKVVCPPAALLVRGAIIGTVVITDWVRTSENPWFIGPGALVMEKAEAIEPIPCAGALGFFEWKQSGELTPPAKWMLPKAIINPTTTDVEMPRLI